MTRPNIVRADTIDLQDQDSPSAAEHHHRPALQGGLAQHQRAEIHHVIEERTSEEHALADAWKMADDLTEEPGTIDEAQQQHQSAEHHVGNGMHHDAEYGVEGGGGGGSEVEVDDDMMDRISSSPSIDDGGYFTPYSSPPPSSPSAAVWPERKSSLSPSPSDTPTPTRETFNQSASSTPASSPFLHTPQHLPLHVRRTGKAASPLLREDDWSSSPFESNPSHLPLINVEDADGSFSFASEHHHQMGRYRPLPELESIEDEGFHEEHEDPTGISVDCQLREARRTNIHPEYNGDRSCQSSTKGLEQNSIIMEPSESPFRKNAWAQRLCVLPETKLEQSPSLTSIGSVDLKDVLLPVDDPLLDTPPSPTNSSGSWESLPSSEDDSLDPRTNDDDTDALFNNLDDRFIDSGWGGECLRDTEDIDFDFVYALHTFVATVEGQANATKGDTMVLLDDSNSYWWLVRVVKDSSIGYLPAEHIETPTERLARLNKHRNIDLSATMLSDNSEKTRNPLKKFKRRNAKAVQFAAPTYVEASDYDYSDDEEDATVQGYGDAIHAEDAQQQNGEHAEEAQIGETGIAQEEAPRASTPTRGSFDREQAATIASSTDDPQLSPKLVDKSEAAPLKSRKSRNTDSFLKDDSIETRKITITPGLLREEQGAKASSSSDTARSESLENIVKQVAPTELSKKDSKKEKDRKKDGFIKGLFKSKKKDKKSKDEAEEKASDEYGRESPVVSPLTSGSSSPGQDTSSVMAVMDSRTPEIQARSVSQENVQDQTHEQPNPTLAELQGSEAAHEMESSLPLPINTALAQQDKPKDGPLSPITNLLKRDDSKSQKPAKAKRAKERVELDDFDSPDEEDEPNPFKEEEEEEEGRASAADQTEDRLSESPVDITQDTYMHGTESVHVPTPGPYDQPGVEDDDDEEPESMTTSPSLIEHPSEPAEESNTTAQDDDDSTPKGPRSPDTAVNQADKTVPAPTRGISNDSTSSSSNQLSPATPVSQQSWSDSSLRAWLEDGSEIKDMMVMIHDKSGVVPVSDDHPLMAGLFTEQKRGVQDMMTQLDGLLGSYLQRKGIAFA